MKISRKISSSSLLAPGAAAVSLLPLTGPNNPARQPQAPRALPARGQSGDSSDILHLGPPAFTRSFVATSGVSGVREKHLCVWDCSMQPLELGPGTAGVSSPAGSLPCPQGHLWHHRGLGRGSISSPGKGREGAQGIQLAKPGGTGGKAGGGGCQARSQGLALPTGARKGGVGFSCSSMQ